MIHAEYEGFQISELRSADRNERHFVAIDLDTGARYRCVVLRGGMTGQFVVHEWRVLDGAHAVPPVLAGFNPVSAQAIL